jgi:hypothetical protein
MRTALVLLLSLSSACAEEIVINQGQAFGGCYYGPQRFVVTATGFVAVRDRYCPSASQCRQWSDAAGRHIRCE